MTIKTCFVLLLLVSSVTSFNSKFKQRSSALQQLQDLLDDDEQENYVARRNHQHKNDEIADEINSYRRLLGDNDDDDNEEEEYLELRVSSNSSTGTTGSSTSVSAVTTTAITITLQNRAVMNTRLRVLYIDSAGNPQSAETGALLIGQTKSLTIPAGSQRITVFVDKDMVFGTWRNTYKNSLVIQNQCIRITGITVSAKIQACK